MLKKRINAIISQIEFRTLADIGCDHAFIPIFALEQNKIDGAIAIDIAALPLANAKKNISLRGLSNKIKTRLGEGLFPLNDGEAECITIAGLGSSTILEILKNIGKFSSIKQLIISPQTNLNLFREFIENSQFYIQNEVSVAEEDRNYTIFNCKHKSVKRKKVKTNVKIKEIIEKIEFLAPKNLALDWDNIGLLIGDDNLEVKNVLISLDADDNTIKKAIEIDANLIITHHPIVFKGLKHVNTHTALGRRVIELIKNDITVYTAHTNLDVAEEGVNLSLFNRLSLTNKNKLTENLGLIGTLKNEFTLKQFANFTASKLNVPILRYVGKDDAIVKKIAICGGSAMDDYMLKSAVNAGADVYITGDLRYHESQKARDLGMNLIDATHYATEVLVLEDIKLYLQKHFENLNIQISDREQIFKGV